MLSVVKTTINNKVYPILSYIDVTFKPPYQGGKEGDAYIITPLDDLVLYACTCHHSSKLNI